jgi:TonB family protein
MRIRYLLVSSLLAGSVARAQATVGGQVVERTKNVPLPQVMVSLVNADSAVVDSIRTGPDGTFLLSAPGGGAFRVRLKAPNATLFLSDTITVAAGAYVMRSFPIDAVPQPYLEFQVDKPVTPIKGSPFPKYPSELREDHTSGCVLAEFVVDASGKPEVETFKVLKMSHLGFAQAVLKALPEMRYTPAKIGTQNVRQLVQVPFDFSIQSTTKRVVVYTVERVDAQTGSPVRPPETSAPPPPPRQPQPTCK